MTETDQTARALAIRDHLLPLFEAHDTMQEVSGVAGRLAVFKAEGFTCTLRSPFTAWPAEAPPAASYEQAISRQRAKPALPWCLEVWHGHTVLSLQWDDDGRVEVVSFTRGPWEAEALAMGADEPSPGS
jgi:hypothetical protein